MRFEDHSPSGDRPDSGATPPPPPPPAPSDPGDRPRRRPTRSWSTPPPSPSPSPQRFDLPSSGEDWSFRGRRRFTDPAAVPVPGEVPPPPLDPPPTAMRPPRPSPALGAPSAAADLGAVTGLLGQLRAEVAQVRAALDAGAADRQATLVTGAELAATIEALGNTLGSGMATLLTEHRNLLARDLDAAADRILEELGQRLRATTGQTVDGVEERLRQVTSKALGDLGEQLDLRLDQLQTDVAGLRAVMLELPDQTAVAERIDHLVESVGSRPRDTGRVTPAVAAAVERSVGSALEPLTAELASLRRRISLRTEGGGAVELSDAQLEVLADRVAARLAGEAPPPARGGVPLLDEDLDADDGEDEAPPARSRRASTTAKKAVTAPAPAKRVARRR